MSDLELSTTNLPVTIAKYADELGGELYQNEMIDGFSIARKFWPRHQLGESYAEFKARRARDESNDTVLSNIYELTTGITTSIAKYPPEILEALGDEYEEPQDCQDHLWFTDSSAYTFAHNFTGGNLIVSSREQTWGVGDAIMLELPIIGGKPVLDSAIAESVQITVSDERDGVELAEYTIGGAELTVPEATSFESMLGSVGLVGNRLDECLLAMTNIMMILQVSGPPKQ